MKQKELTISIPEGYEIDKEKSTFEKIIFKPVDSKIRSWEEYMKTSIEGKWTVVWSERISQYTSSTPIKLIEPSVIFDSKEEAEAVQALTKLRLLRNQWVCDWKPADDESVFVIKNTHYSGISIFQSYCTSCLNFPTEEMADDFISTFRPLLEQAKLFL